MLNTSCVLCILVFLNFPQIRENAHIYDTCHRSIPIKKQKNNAVLNKASLQSNETLARHKLLLLDYETIAAGKQIPYIFTRKLSMTLLQRGITAINTVSPLRPRLTTLCNSLWNITNRDMCRDIHGFYKFFHFFSLSYHAAEWWHNELKAAMIFMCNTAPVSGGSKNANFSVVKKKKKQEFKGALRFYSFVNLFCS